MAEERFIDEDKDRKYKIRKNEDGEDELYIDDCSDEEEEETPVFEYPVFGDGDDEEAAVLTPEQLAERERLKEEQRRARDEKVNAFIAGATQKLAEGDYESALYAAHCAEELDEKCGAAHCIILRALTRDFTTFTAAEDGAAVAEKVKEYASGEQKEELKKLSAPLEEAIEKTQAKTRELDAENEKSKALRRQVFLENRRTATKAFASTGAAFLVLLIIAICLSTVMFADENGVYLVSTIAVGSVAFVALVATLITARIFWRAQRNVRLNERDSSTELGRKVIEGRKETELLKKIQSAYSL